MSWYGRERRYGAHVVVVAGCVIGRWALVAAGAVVTHNVADFALVAGTPARRIGWVGRAGQAPGAGRRWPLALPANRGILMRNTTESSSAPITEAGRQATG